MTIIYYLLKMVMFILYYLYSNIRAIIAIARMILTAIYQMLSTGEAWNPTDLYKIDIPEPLKEKQKEKAIKQAKKLLIREGILSESQLAS